MNLVDILTIECVKVPLESKDKRGVIEELVDLLASAGQVASRSGAWNTPASVCWP